MPDAGERRGYGDALARYADAVALADELRREWEALGCPKMAEGSMRQPIPHPLVKMITDADAAAARHGEVLGIGVAAKRRTGKAGRPPGAASAPDRAAPAKITRLKAV